MKTLCGLATQSSQHNPPRHTTTMQSIVAICLLSCLRVPLVICSDPTKPARPADGARAGKFLGITGYLSGAYNFPLSLSHDTHSGAAETIFEENKHCHWLKGSSDGFRVAPFWKQWNAILQINIEKNRHNHNGVYVVPASLYYYPPYDQLGYYPPPSLSGVNNGFPLPSNSIQSPYRPMILFDDIKPPEAAQLPVRFMAPFPSFK